MFKTRNQLFYIYLRITGFENTTGFENAMKSDYIYAALTLERKLIPNQIVLT